MKKLILLSILLAGSQYIHPYKWTIVNGLNYSVDIQVCTNAAVESICMPANLNETAIQITLHPGDSHEFDFTGIDTGLCLNRIIVNGQEIDLSPLSADVAQDMDMTANTATPDDEASGVVVDIGVLASFANYLVDRCSSITIYLARIRDAQGKYRVVAVTPGQPVAASAAS